jgi:hypothetical protein
MGTRFRIRATVPGYPRVYDPNRPEPELFYDEIDIMCYLLNGYPYKELYGGKSTLNDGQTLEQVLSTMLNKLAMIPEDLVTRGIAAEAAKILAVMRDWLKANQPNLRLRDLYTTDYRTDMGITTNIVVPYRRLQALSGGRLCLPYVAVQDTGVTIPVADMDTHIDEFGPYSLQDLYTMPKVRKALDVARDQALGILSHPGTYSKADYGEVTGCITNVAATPPGGNYRECDPQRGCVDTQNNTFCNVASDGTCSTISG